MHMWKKFKSECAVTGQEAKVGRKLKLAERRKNKPLSSQMKRSDTWIFGCPVYTCPESTGTSG